MAEQSWAKHVADVLRRNGIRLSATVPDYIVGYVLDELWVDPACRVVTTTREEEAVGLLSGAWLAGKRGKGPSTAPFDQDLIGQATRLRKALAALPAS
ncbi:MAG TPA: hypothetical protein VFS98_00290 [Methylomirabilota bacterium]|nr:hypothetical protein [Methylomirabilota bacterium]